MRISKMSFWVGAVLLSISGPIAFAQSFQVTGRTTPGGTNRLKLDESLVVTYQVNATGLTQPVVPVLVPSAGHANSISTTWTGTSPTTNLSNLSFNIHLYDSTSLCGQDLPFSLIFFSTQFSGSRTATPQNPSLMQFETSASGEVSLTHLISEVASTIPFPLPTGIRQFPMVGNVISNALLQDPNNRIYFYIDYNTMGFDMDEVFNFNAYPLNDNCPMEVGIDIFSSPETYYVNGDITDRTGATPVPINPAPIGGAGENLGDEGINVFDITDINLNDGRCSGTPRDDIDYSSPPFNWAYDYPSDFSGSIIRAIRLYLGTQGECSALVSNFGSPPGNNFHIEDFFFSSEGDVSGRLVVPSAWGSATTLNNNFRVQWFLRRDEEMIALGGESTSLSFNANSGSTISNPAGYYLEARVRETGSNARVSTTSGDYSHPLNHDVLTPQIIFSRAEQSVITGTNADDYLDPGEIITMPYRVTQASGGNLPGLDFQAGLVIDENGNLNIDGPDTFLTQNTPREDEINLRFIPLNIPGGVGNSKTFDVDFELLTAPQLNGVWFYIETEADAPVFGTTTTYRHYFSIRELLGSVRDINAEFTTFSTDFDFNVAPGQDWLATAENAEANSGSWDYPSSEPGPWTGDGGQNTENADDLYSLVSPLFGLGSNSSFSFSHMPQFSFNQSGGILEYRTKREGQPFTDDWDNFIQEFCPTCGIYNDFPFPGEPVSYLSNQRVWMSNESVPSIVNLNVPATLPNQFPLGDGQIQFRFLFQDPSLVDTGTRSDGPTHWEIYNFSYETSQLLEDNIFRISSLDLHGCDNPGLTFNNDAPVAVANLVFEWFETLTDLFNDDSTGGNIAGVAGTVPPFSPPPGNHEYYVRVKFSGTERVHKVNFTEPATSCEPVCLTRDEALEAILEQLGDNDWPHHRDVLDYIGTINLICAPE